MRRNMAYQPSKDPVRMGAVTKVFDEPMTVAEKKQLHDVEHALVKRNARLRALKKDVTKLLGDAIKENEARIYDQGGVVLAIERGTYPQEVPCVAYIDEQTWEVFLCREDGREVDGSRRKLTDAQIKAHKRSRSQLDLFGEGDWTPISLPETHSDAPRSVDDIPIDELQRHANAEIIDLAAVRQMMERDLLAGDDDDDGEDEDERPRKRAKKDDDASGGAGKPRGKSKPELRVVTKVNDDAGERGPFASPASSDDTAEASNTIPPSVRVVYVLYVDGALDTVDASEVQHELSKCTIVHGAADDVNEDALDADAAPMKQGELSTGHKFAIRQVVDTELAGVASLLLNDGDKLLGYVVQDEHKVIGVGVDVEETITDAPTRAQAPQRIAVDLPDGIRAEVKTTLVAAIRDNGGAVDGRDLLRVFADASQIDVGDMPTSVSTNLVELCEELVTEGVLVRRGTSDDGAVYAHPTLTANDQLH